MTMSDKQFQFPAVSYVFLMQIHLDETRPKEMPWMNLDETCNLHVKKQETSSVRI
jgi:hypothetical protein